MNTISWKYRVDRRDIAFLRFVFEACDGIAVVTTTDAAAGRVTLQVAPGCEAEVEAVLAGLSKEIFMEAEKRTPVRTGSLR